MVLNLICNKFVFQFGPRLENVNFLAVKSLNRQSQKLDCSQKEIRADVSVLNFLARPPCKKRAEKLDQLFPKIFEVCTNRIKS